MALISCCLSVYLRPTFVPILFVVFVFIYTYVSFSSVDHINSHHKSAVLGYRKPLYTAIDYSNLTTHYGMLPSSRWLEHLSDRIELLPASLELKADLIFYEAEGDSGDIYKDVSYIMNNKPNHTIATFILTGDDLYVPDHCSDKVSSLFYVTHYNLRSNCKQINITYHTVFANTNPFYIEQGRHLALDRVYPAHPRPILANFVGTSWTYPSRSLLMYFNQYPDMFIRFNDDYWWRPQKSDYYYKVRNISYHALEQSIFTFSPRGRGLSSMRLIEAILLGSIPVLLDDESKPFGQTLEFAIRRSLPKQNLTTPLTQSTKLALDQLYRELKDISSNPLELQRRRKMMLKFYRDYLVPDLKYSKYRDTYPDFPFSSRVLRDINHHAYLSHSRLKNK